jgi:ATP-dependent Clp protease ATP-binding subunit ClpA
VGQDEATAVAGMLRAVGIEGPESSHRQLYLLGPTGVGKTELARSGRFLFDDERAMIASICQNTRNA